MKNKPFFILILFLSISCNIPDNYFKPPPECTTVLPFQNQHQPTSETYQKEVIKLLLNEQPASYRYFFKTFFQENNKDFMLVNFRKDDQCFDVKILVNNWKKLAGMKRTNGKSYPSELYDLQWVIKILDEKQTVIYQDMHDIID